MDRAQACEKIHVSLKGGTTAEGQTAEHRCVPQRHGAWASAAPGTLPRDSVPSDLASQTRARAGALPRATCLPPHSVSLTAGAVQGAGAAHRHESPPARPPAAPQADAA